jgi:hypothetical protein
MSSTTVDTMHTAAAAIIRATLHSTQPDTGVPATSYTGDTESSTILSDLTDKSLRGPNGL